MRFICLALAGLAWAMPTPADEAQSTTPSNRLAKESSPYLLLHAHNPVDWYPWGPEAFEKARSEDKPIFLSIGYSSCYWCHVMERKVFSNAAIAKYMNENFVNIKVDREERPDVDDIYMTSLIVYQQFAGSGGGGGWPLSMFLTPAGNPIAGATYLPPEDTRSHGRGFPSVARRIRDLWTERKPDLERTAAMVAEQVQRVTRPGLDLQKIELDHKLLNGAIAQVKELYDPKWGGVDFNKQKPTSPRFPNAPRLELTLDMYESTGDKALLEIVEHSLTQMARGGIRDHLAGGFHRYSTDRRWHVPHFEKMLYDQAMLLGIYTRAAEITKKPEYAAVAAEISDFVRSELTTDQGAFCTALDAETNAIEGEYYVWSADEVESILGKDNAKVFATVYGIDQPNPFEHGFVLHLPRSTAESAKLLSMTETELLQRLVKLRTKLLEHRSNRERPLLDDKILTAWNALMIRALAMSGRELNRPADIQAARTAANFLLSNLRTKDGHLQRTWRGGTARYAGYLDDYAFTVAALLELHRSTGEARWLSEATAVAELQNELFYDDSLQAYYYTASNHEKLIARTSSAYDSIFPSANSVSVLNLLRMNELQQSDRYEEIARNTLARFASSLDKSPASCSGLARALHFWLQINREAKTPESNALSNLELPDYRLTAWQEKPQPQTKIETSDNGKSQKQNSAAPEADVQNRSVFRPVIPSNPPANGFAQADKPKPLKVKVYPMYDKLPQKGKCLVAIELQVKFGWHINANPSNPDFLKPTTIEVKSKQKVKLTKIKYPKHHELKVDGAENPYHVYDGKTMVYGLLEIDEKDSTKFADLEFHVRFQGCNSTQCLPPDLVVMKGKLPLAAKGEKIKKINEAKFPKPKEKKESPAGAESRSKSPTK